MMRFARCLWYVLTLRCEEADRVRAVRRREDLSLSERIGERAHSSLCASCRRARRQLELLQTLLNEVRNESAGDDPVGEGVRAGPGLDDATRRRIAAGLAATGGNPEAG